MSSKIYKIKRNFCENINNQILSMISRKKIEKEKKNINKLIKLGPTSENI